MLNNQIKHNIVKEYKDLKHLQEFLIRHITLLSQLPAMRNVDGSTPGLNARELTLSSGADVTSMSFMGLWLVCVLVLLNTPVVPNVDVPPPNKLILETDAPF